MRCCVSRGDERPASQGLEDLFEAHGESGRDAVLLLIDLKLLLVCEEDGEVALVRGIRAEELLSGRAV